MWCTWSSFRLFGYDKILKKRCPVYQVSQAMSKIFVRVQSTHTVRDAINLLNEKKQTCALVVDDEDYLEGILTLGDIRRRGLELGANVSSPKGDASDLDVCPLLFFTFSISIHGYICFCFISIMVSKDISLFKFTYCVVSSVDSVLSIIFLLSLGKI